MSAPSPMHESFHGGIDAAALTELSRRTNGAALARAIGQFALLAGSAATLLTATSPWLFWPALLVQTVMQLAMFGLLHETTHGTAFRSGTANGVAKWLAAVWQFAPPAWMRAFHFTHHRHTHELARDPELSGLEWMARWPRGAAWLATASGLTLLLARAGLTLLATTGATVVFAKAMPYVAPDQRRVVARDARILVLVHAALIALAATTMPAIAWLYVAAAAAHALLSLYVTCEHRGLPTGASDVLQCTRSLRAGPLLRFVLWNMPFHAEHHAHPSVPFHALPRLHARLAPLLVHTGRSVLDLHCGRGPVASTPAR